MEEKLYISQALYQTAKVVNMGKWPSISLGIGKPLRIQLAHLTFSFASSKYVMLQKIEFFQAGNLEKHLRDIANIMETANAVIDFSFLHEQINQPSLHSVLDRVKTTKQSSQITNY